ncbi:conserved hypothetical protein [Parafrankia sp. Ea1.12]|nr:conserved hypothetical protein [Parafrankia sp. Ea1.12]
MYLRRWAPGCLWGKIFMTIIADASPDRPDQSPAAVREERDRARRLIDNGRATMAVIDTVSDTGVRVDGRTVAEVHLLVERPGQEPYPVTRRAVVPADEAGASPVGDARGGIPSQLRRRVPVLVDPARPDNVLLRWDLRVAS